MVRPRSALSMEKLTLDTPSFRAFEKTLVRAGTTSDLAAKSNVDLPFKKMRRGASGAGIAWHLCCYVLRRAHQHCISGIWMAMVGLHAHALCHMAFGIWLPWSAVVTQLLTCLFAPVGSRPSVMKSSAKAPYSRFTMCSVARMRPLHIIGELDAHMALGNAKCQQSCISNSNSTKAEGRCGSHFRMGPSMLPIIPKSM